MNLFRKFTTLALLSLICIASCKKDRKKNATGSTDENITNVASVLNTQKGAAFTFMTSMEAGKDSLDAFIEVINWLLQQPAVNKVFITSSSVLRIEYKSGLEGFISTIATDAAGTPYGRGGGGEGVKNGSLKNFYRSTADEFVISNKKVLVFSPYFAPIFNYDQKLSNGKHKLQATQYTGKDADLSIINTFKDYGLIVINTHGLPHGFQIKCKVTFLNAEKKPDGQTYTDDEIRDMFTEANGLPLDKFLNNELSLNQVVYFYNNPGSNDMRITSPTDIVVRDKYIRNLPKMDNAVVFGNYCYSGFTYDGPAKNNMSEAFKSLGVVAYYGYAFSDGSSAPVYNPWANYMEDTLISSLIDGDSTGVAHLANNITLQQDFTQLYKKSTSTDEMEAKFNKVSRSDRVFQPVSEAEFEDYAFRQFFDPRYKYESCGTITDVRDGEVYQLACIGDQQWMAENLRYNAPGSLVYNNDNSKLATYGRLYTYGMASGGTVIGSETGPGLPGICPNGWHIPNRQDYEKLVAHLNTISTTKHGLLLKSKTLWVNDSQEELDDPLRSITGFNAFPGGIGKNATSGLLFFYGGEETQFWASSLLSTGSIPNSVGVYKISGTSLSVFPLVLGPGLSSDISYLSCRCVKNQ